jgi:eukaryotic-like serine/threonine-protein kinase
VTSSQENVAAQPPKRFGPYEVVALLGTGGMGEVYRARDPRLNRDVAIKVLARASVDAAHRKRLLDEAQAASALNHPNIITVYDVGTHEGTPFIVSELIEGRSLREILARAPLSVREMLDLGAQIADGLAAAHQVGIVHRDLKPENVMVTRDGRVKILDFGLALVGMRDGVQAAAADVTLTANIMIVGTIPYMSPEQARGATVDYRTDQFSLGLTLYEMATGRRAFGAETSAQTLAAILDDEPEPVGKLNARVPAPVRWVIERCLLKDARQRYDATTDLARELRTLRDRVAEYTPPTEPAVPQPPRRRVRAMLAFGALAAVAAIGVLAGLANNGAGTDLGRYRFTPIATDAGYQGLPAWSPDGKTLAYVAERDGVQQIFTRSIGSSMRSQVTHSRFDCRDPFWSPDGTRLYYIALARERDGLWSITSVGGEPELVMENVSRAALSPDGRTLAFFRAAGNDVAGLYQLWLSSPPASPPVQYTRPPFGARRGYSDATMIHFSPDGSKLGAWVVPYWVDARKLQPEFWVIPMRDADPYVAPAPAADLAAYAAPFSWLPDSRRIVTALRYPIPGVHLWLIDTERPAPRLLTMTGSIENDPAVSPDGARLALSVQQADYDLYQLSVEHPAPSVLLATSRSEMDPAWSPLGDLMAFTTDRTGHEEIWLRSQSGDWERPLVRPEDFGAGETYLLNVAAFSPDGQRIAYYRDASTEGQRIWITPVAGGPPVQLASGEYAQDSPAWSPDGAWIAFTQWKQGDWALAKTRLGTRTTPEVLAHDIIPFSRVQWSLNDKWIAYNGRGGLSLVSPDGKSTRIVQDQPWLTFTWSHDSRLLYGIRQSDDFQHLTFASVDIESKAERVLGADFMPLPVAGQPVRGFTRVSPTTFVTSIAHVRSDIWLLDGFQPPGTLWDRLAGLVSPRRR